MYKVSARGEAPETWMQFGTKIKCVPSLSKINVDIISSYLQATILTHTVPCHSCLLCIKYPSQSVIPPYI